MCSTPVEVPAAARARWLAEVAGALEKAELLANQLRLRGYRGALLAELEWRIAVAKREVESLQVSRPPRQETNPKWTSFAPWESGN